MGAQDEAETPVFRHGKVVMKKAAEQMGFDEAPGNPESNVSKFAACLGSKEYDPYPNFLGEDNEHSNDYSADILLKVKKGHANDRTSSFNQHSHPASTHNTPTKPGAAGGCPEIQQMPTVSAFKL